MHRFHIPGALPSFVRLPESEALHLTRVLRLGVGAEIVVFDGAGREWLGRVAQAARGEVHVDLIGERPALAEPPVHVTLVVSLLKGDQMDAIVRDATMLGVSAIAPVVSAHTVVPERARQTRAVERWTRIAIASAKQCGRAVVPAIARVARLDALLAEPFDGPRMVCVEPALARTRVRGDDEPERPRAAQLFIGPEGGWSSEELRLFRDQGATWIGLGPRTLRADAVPAVALSALWTIWGWT